ncbi:MAG TPA: cupin domain-containing protein [Xanthobacteraceae bacterium]|nr:cupin domain-containing protein [Xanthobacteraceae bacterium]
MPVLSGFSSFATVPEERISNLISRKSLSGEQGMLVWWDIKAGGHAAAHSHPHEQIFWMISGRMEMRMGDERRMCGPGDVGVIPGGVEHEAWFHEDTVVIDVFAPPRADFLAGGPPPYMRSE